jgi:RHS repeat-associated protein
MVPTPWGPFLSIVFAALVVGAQQSLAQDAYQRPTIDVQKDPADPSNPPIAFHPDLVAKANELETPLRIFEFVHDQIEYEVYYGSKKGALGALWSRRANDFDQASLLIGLLRARGYRARYVIGVVSLPMEQAKNWAGMLDTQGTKDLFITAYCWDDDPIPPALPAPLCPLTGPKRFEAVGDTAIQIEHAWVEVESNAYRGLQVGDSSPTWIPLDPSWTQKVYQAGLADVQIAEESEAGVCASGKVCFDYDGYYSKTDPRLPTEIWETKLQTWLATYDNGKTIGDIPYDGPIQPLGLEVLPLSLPFEPVVGFALLQTADLGTLSDGIPRRFRLQVVVTGQGELLSKTFDFPDIVARRLTLAFEPTAASRATVLRLGGYLAGPWQSEPNLASYCAAHSGNSNCETVPVLKVDGVACGAGCTTTTDVPLASQVAVVVDRDLLPGRLASQLQGTIALATYFTSVGTYAAIGLDAVHAGEAQFQGRLDQLLGLPDTHALAVEENDENDNGVENEVLLDRGSAGITACTDLEYAEPNAMDVCDVAIAANFAHNDAFVGAFLHLGTLRYFQRLREEQRRLFAVDRVAGLLLPAVGVTTGGLSVDYLFDRPLGVEASYPVIDIRGLGDVLDRIDAPTASVDREARLLAHVGSALEHQVWEELTGREFVSTVKGFQIAGETYPEQDLLISSTWQQHNQNAQDLAQFSIFDFPGSTYQRLQSLAFGGNSSVKVIAPRVQVVGSVGIAEVRIEEEQTPAGTLFAMLIAANGSTAGGGLGFESSPTSFLDFGVLPGDSNLWGRRSTTADPVSIVSGNNFLEESDLLIPTHGPPFQLTRAYNSQSEDQGALGHGWTHSYEMRVEPPREEQAFDYLPQGLVGFKDLDEVQGAISDTLDTWNEGTGSVEIVQWEGLPATFTDKVTVEKLELELAYRGAGFSFELHQGALVHGPISVPDAPDVVATTKTFELPAALNLGSPFEVRFPTGFSGADMLFYAKVRIHFRGPHLDRLTISGPSITWDSNGNVLRDKDDATCATVGAGEDVVESLSWGVSSASGVFGFEVTAALNARVDSDGRAALGLYLPGGGTKSFLLGPNPEQHLGTRVHFFTTTLDALPGYYEAIGQPHVELCELRRTAFLIRDEREFVSASGVRERFTKSGSTWSAASGVRNRLTEITSGGYRITRPDGSTLDFTQPGPDGAYQLKELSDAQGRRLILAYNAGTQRLQSVSEEGAPSRQLTFAYDANGFIDTVTDWSGRVWDYTVDENGDLVEFKDPLAVQNAWPGIQYAYETGHDENPDLDHNLKRVTHPEDGPDSGPDGDRWIEFTYYNDDKVASHTDSLGNTQTFLFNFVRLENQTTDPRGFTTIYRHDVKGNLIERRDPDGAVWAWTYDSNRNVTTETDPFGRKRQFSGFDPKGNPGQIVDRDAKQLTLTYDPLTGAPTTIVDKRGNVRTIQFTTDGLPEYTYATLDGQGAPGTLLSTNVYDTTSRRLTQTTEPLGDGTGRVRDARFFYDTTGRDLSRVESRNENGAVIAKVEYDYDTLGRPRFERVQREVSASDPTLIQLVTETEYNARDQVESVVRPDGTLQVAEYDKNGNVKRQFLEEHRPDGQVVLHGQTQLVYDAMDRVVTSLDAAGGTTTYAYDASGNRISMTDPEGHTWRTEYDAMNRPFRVQDPNGAVTETRYDVAGRIVATIDATGIETRREYDAIGRLVEYQYGDRPSATRAVFYGPGTAYREELTDPENRVTAYKFDDLGRVFETTDAANGTTLVAYTLLGSAQTVTDPVNLQTAFSFDTLGRAVTVDPYYAGAELLSYDQTGNVIRRTKPDLCVLEQDYDAMGRVVERRTAEGNTSGSCANSPIDDQFGYDARGLLVAAQNDAVGLIREYDALGRMLREIDTRFGTGVGYAYDPASRLTSKVYPDGSSVHYAYDGAGRTVGISDPFGETTRFVYDGAGRRVQKLGTQGLRTEYDYHPATGWLTGVTSYTQTGGIAADFSYPTHDDVGNRLAMTETSGGTTSYTYDALDRLATLDPPNESIYPASGALTHFAYDGAGNRTDFGPKSGGSFVAPHAISTYTASKRLLAITTSQVGGGQTVESLGGYDSNGNPGTWTPPGASARTLKFDALGRLVEITGGFSASYAYDPFGRRIEKSEAGTTTRYQYDGLDVVAEYSASQLEATYVFGPGMDEVLKLKRGTAVAAYHSDGLGSVVAISEGGALSKTYRYDAFGKPIAQTGTLSNAYTYTGRELDGSGLYYYRARYYLPSAGRFLTPDPIGLAGGINAYAYVSSNPVNYTDPFGLFAGQAFGPAWPELPAAFSAQSLLSDAVYASHRSRYVEGMPFAPSQREFVAAPLEFSGPRDQEQAFLRPELAPLVARTGTRVGLSAVFVSSVATAGAFFGTLLYPSELGDGSDPLFYHYTNETGRAGISELGVILSSDDNLVYLTPTVYRSGTTARAELALRQTPTGYFQLPRSSLPGLTPAGTVPPGNGQPGGGQQFVVPGPVPVDPTRWIPIEP